MISNVFAMLASVLTMTSEPSRDRRRRYSISTPRRWSRNVVSEEVDDDAGGAVLDGLLEGVFFGSGAVNRSISPRTATCARLRKVLGQSELSWHRRIQSSLPSPRTSRPLFCALAAGQKVPCLGPFPSGSERPSSGPRPGCSTGPLTGTPRSRERGHDRVERARRDAEGVVRGAALVAELLPAGRHSPRRERSPAASQTRSSSRLSTHRAEDVPCRTPRAQPGREPGASAQRLR